MSGGDPKRLTTDDLLHPERFGLTELKQIVKNRGGMWEEGATLDDITKLYSDLVLPKPQRKYNVNTRLGRRMLENQCKSNDQDEEMSVDIHRGKEIGDDKNSQSRKRVHESNGTRGAQETTKTSSEPNEDPPTKKRPNVISWP